MHNILVVDDEKDIRESLRGILEDEGYKVAVAESGEACLSQLKNRSSEVVLLDIWLTGMDGLETLEQIRQLQLEEMPEVVMISGHGSIETAVKATKLGAFDFLEKPLSLERTLIVLKNAFEAHKQITTAMAKLETGTLLLNPQPGEGVTYAKKIDKAETRLDWARPARQVQCPCSPAP